jgi:RHS repeat-associated protein
MKKVFLTNSAKTMKTFSAIMFFLLLSTFAHAQWSGPTSVRAGGTATYTFNNGETYSRANWSIVNGVTISSSSSGSSYTCEVKWDMTCSTSGSVTFKNLSTTIGTLNVNITQGNPADPVTTFTVTKGCRTTTVTRDASPPAGITWYWQTSSGGTDISNAGTSMTVSTSSFVYLRAYFCGYWSSGYAEVNAVVIDPDTPTGVEGGTRCGPGSVTLSATPGSQADNIRWYDAGSGGSLQYTGTSFPVYPDVGTSVTYYAASYNSTYDCESTTRVAATATANPIPQVINLPASISICSGAPLNFIPVSDVSGSSFSWTSSVSGTVVNVSSSGAGAITDTPVNPGNTNGTVTYSVSAAKNGCTGDATTYTVTVKPIPTLSVDPASQALCSGQTTSFALSNPNNVSGTTFSWTQSSSNVTGAFDGTGSSISQTLSSTNGSSQGTLTYTITATANSCSSPTSPATATVNPNPEVPTASSQTFCASGNITPTLGLNANTIHWYNALTGGSLVTVATTSPTVNATTTYYITSFNTSTGCESTAARLAVTLTIDPIPTITTNGSTILLYGNGTQLSTISSYSYQWKKDAVNISGATQQTFDLGVPGSITVGVKASASSPECVSAPVSLTAPLQNQPAPVNFVSTTRILKEGVTTNTSLYSLNKQDIAQIISYQDAIGRTFQTIGVGLSPQQTDMVSLMTYGKQGLMDTTFLPYATPSKDGRFRLYAIRNATDYTYVNSEQQQFYQNTSAVAQDSQPFARAIYRSAPDARITEQGAPGADWQPGNHTVKNLVSLNNSSYPPVRYWQGNGQSSTYYPQNSLILRITTDENGNQVRTYTNAQGQTVLRQVQINETLEGSYTEWLDTYYIYDNFGRRAYIVPPKAMKLLTDPLLIDANNPSVAELIYTYTYDTRGRVIEKKVPAAAVEYFVYDKLDRVVLTQNGSLRALSKWTFIKYDKFGRVVYTGLYNDSSTRSILQSQFDGLNYDTQPWYEIEEINATHHGYSNQAEPKADLTIMSVNYYDHYDFDRNGTNEYNYDSTHLTDQESIATSKTRGLPTGSKQVIVDTSGVTTNWLVNIAFYDRYHRLVQIQGNNHLYQNVADKTTVIYDFSGKTLKTKSTHNSSDTVSVNVQDTLEYDHAGRVTSLSRKINNEAEQRVAQYNYNAIGQLTTKNIHDKGSSTWLQTVDYSYTIRGWLKTINDPGNIGNDFYAQEMVYNESLGALEQTPAYNGNITAIKWKEQFGNGMVENQKTYAYAYYKNDQLRQAKFAKGTAFNEEVDAFNEQGITYDANGNIKSMLRKGRHSLDSVVPIDDLNYTYSSVSQNRLVQVEDASANLSGFNNRVTSSTEFSYDESGNTSADLNKNISAITYNVLGKPEQVNFTDGKIIQYVYDAGGNKLRMTVTQSSGTTTTDYAGSFVYENGSLIFFGSPEGRIVVDNGAYEYQYALSDHQGNTRTVFTSKEETLDFKATFETGTSGLRADTDLFENTAGANEVSSTAANTTQGGSRAVRLNNEYHAGPGLMLRVYPGDKIDVEVNAYHENSLGYGTSASLGTMITSIAAAFGGVSGGGGESGLIYNAFEEALTILGLGGNQGDSLPSAWLNYIFFDDNEGFDVVNQDDDAGWRLVPAGAFMNRTAMNLDVPVIKKPGLLYIYLSYENESPNWVYFDDLSVTYKKSQVVQSNNYYAFGGSTQDSWTRMDTKSNQFLYNAGSELNKSTGNYEMFFRGYDAALGRMTGVDPLAPMYASQSPYHYAANNPISINDPTGAYYVSELDYYNRVMAAGGSIGQAQRIMDTGTFGGGSGSYGSSGNLSDGGNHYWGGTIRNPGFSSSVWNEIGSLVNQMWGNTNPFDGESIYQAGESGYYMAYAEIDYSETYTNNGKIYRGIPVIGYKFVAFKAQQGWNILTNPTGLGIRNDDGGLGHYGAPRGNRPHYGIDFRSVDGQDILSPVAGRAINSFFTKRDGTKVPTVVIYPADPNLGFNKLELLYVGPMSGEARIVTHGQVVGQSVNLQGLGYPSSVGSHIHLQMRLNGAWVDPTPYFFGD